jgi:hypothetical protein
MAATLELKYFNSFWLKKMDSIVNILTTEGLATITTLGSYTITLQQANLYIGVGQALNYTVSGITYNHIILYENGLTITLNTPTKVPIPAGTKINFGEITDFTYIPAPYAGGVPNGGNDWYVEEARIRGGYNNTSVDFGVKAYLAEDFRLQQNRFNSMIYSGIFNSRTGINNTNQFSVGEDITRTVDQANGSIQKLYAEDTNLIIFQESKVSRALIDKDAVYSAEGQPMTTSGESVIGQIQAYSGNYGISTNPESFAVYGYRKYFVDRNQNAVLRLSQDGITEISSYGMLDYFRDNLALVGSSGKLLGAWDVHNKQYVLSMQPANSSYYQTVSLDENTNGWTSRFSYKPDFALSLRNNYYTLKTGNIFKHYADPIATGVNYCNFYGVQYNASVKLVLNPDVSLCKNFNTLNYEGSNGWVLNSIYSDSDVGLPISAAAEPLNLLSLEDQLFSNSFKRKENKYFGNLINNTASTFGEVIYGQSINGIKGFYATAEMLYVPPPSPTYAELYSVSSNYVKSSY